MNEKLDPTTYFPRIVTLADSSLVRVTRCDADDIVFDRIEALGTTPESYRTTAPAQAVPAIEGFDPETAEQWPSDAAIAERIAQGVITRGPVVVLSPLQILERLTPQEEAALASSSDLAVVIVRNRLIAASEVRSDDPRTAEGRAILIAKGIITEARAAEIFA